MAEITNANQVQLRVKQSGETTELKSMARAAVSDFSFTYTEDNQTVSGVGRSGNVGVTRGNKDTEFSFTITGDDAELFKAVVINDTDTGILESRTFNFVARTPNFKLKATEARLTEFSFEGSDGEAVEYSVSGIATNAYGEERD